MACLVWRKCLVACLFLDRRRPQLQAFPQMDPGIAHFQAFLAACYTTRLHVPDFSQVGTLSLWTSHGIVSRRRQFDSPSTIMSGRQAIPACAAEPYSKAKASPINTLQLRFGVLRLSETRCRHLASRVQSLPLFSVTQVESSNGQRDFPNTGTLLALQEELA
jgi:hypothetical protein